MERETESKVEGEGMKTEPATPEQIAAIRERAELASSAPWEVSETAHREKSVCDRDCIIVTACTNERSCDMAGQMIAQVRDLDFIAHAREDIPLLLATLAARDAEIERLREYTQHRPRCESIHFLPCTCGLDAAMEDMA